MMKMMMMMSDEEDVEEMATMKLFRWKTHHGLLSYLRQQGL